MNASKIRFTRSLVLAIVGVFLVALQARSQDTAGLYKTKCATCHGTDGKGDTPVGKKIGVRDFSSPEVQKESDQELIEITARGKNKMPGYGSTLKNPQIKDLVAYLRDLAKKG